MLRWTEVDPDDASCFARRVRDVLRSISNPASGRFAGSLQDSPVNAYLPTMIYAHKAVAVAGRQCQGCATMRAFLLHHADFAILVTPYDQAQADQLDSLGYSIRLGKFSGQTCRNPVPSDQLPHRSIALHPAEQLVLFMREHMIPRNHSVSRNIPIPNADDGTIAKPSMCTD